MGFPSPATDYIETTLTVNSLCNITANSRVISTDRGYVVVLDLSEGKAGSILHTFCWRTSVCKANG
jgi:DNA polymerase V